MFSLQLPGPASVSGDPSCHLLSLPVTLAEELQCRAQARTVRRLQGKRLGQLQPLPQTLRAWALLQLDGPPRACRAASARLAGAARNKSFREKVRGAGGGLCGPVSRGQVGFVSEKRKGGDGGAAFVRWSRHDQSREWPSSPRVAPVLGAGPGLPSCHDCVPHAYQLTQLSVSTATLSIRSLRRHLRVGCSFFRILTVALLYFRLTHVAGWLVVWFT